MSPSLLAHSRIGELDFICIFSIPLTFLGKKIAGEGYQALAVLSFCLHYLPLIKGFIILTGSYSPWWRAVVTWLFTLVNLKNYFVKTILPPAGFWTLGIDCKLPHGCLFLLVICFLFCFFLIISKVYKVGGKKKSWLLSFCLSFSLIYLPIQNHVQAEHNLLKQYVLNLVALNSQDRLNKVFAALSICQEDIPLKRSSLRATCFLSQGH